MEKKSLEYLFNAVHHEKYNFQDFISSDISKYYQKFEADQRIIHAPNKKLKTYHSFLNLFLFEFLRINTGVVFSYRKGFNAYNAVSKHTSNKHFYQTDLVNFFENIDSDLVKVTVLDSADQCPILDIKENISRIIELVTINQKIPMGFSTSPMISNACLFAFDNQLEALCNQENFIYTRYSDDIIISSKNRNKIFTAENLVKSVLLNLFNDSLKINENKSRISSAGGKVKILGMTLLPNGKISLDLKLRNKIEVHLHYYCSNKEKFLQLVEGKNKEGIEKLSGWINYANTIDSQYLDKLRKKYGTTVIDMFIHKSAQ